MDYGAITVDTSVFDEKGLKLESGILKTLEQFNGKPSRFILSEIVAREVHSHLKRKAFEAREKATKAIQEARLCLSVPGENADAAEHLLIPESSDSDIARKRIESFIDRTGAEIVLATGSVELDQIIKKYFSHEPPFAQTGNKKSEFPDAIALMSLEAWAKKNNTRVLAASRDGDWKRFAEGSPHIDVIEDLAQAIAAFQPPSAGIAFCTNIARTLPTGKPPTLYRSIEQHLADAVGSLDLYAEASSQFHYEPDFVEIVLDSFSFASDSNGNALLQPVQGKASLLLVEAKIRVTATASTTFSLTVRDSIDKDYVYIGSASASTEIEFDSEVLLTFEGDFEGSYDDIELTDLDLTTYPSEVDFGHVEPDWWGDEE